MNSIRDDATLMGVREFFCKVLMPLARRLKDEGRVLFPVGAEPHLETYYVTRDKTTMVPEDFVVAGCDSVDSLEKALVYMWTSQGHPELSILAPILSKLAESLYFVEEQNKEVSPFIYVMF